MFTPREDGRKNDAAWTRHYSARSAPYRRCIVDLLTVNFDTLAGDIKAWGRDLGFQHVAITDLDVNAYRQRFEQWLAAGLPWRDEIPRTPARPAVRSVTTRSWQLSRDRRPHGLSAAGYGAVEDPRSAATSDTFRGTPSGATITRSFAGDCGRLPGESTHKPEVSGYVPIRDSAPILEKALAEKAGLGWIGKHTLLLNRNAGSWFFLGEVLTDLPLPIDAAQPRTTCGRCSACITVCPTERSPAARQLDARRCISYLTIEHKGSIPVELRASIGNRIFGCDDCQLVCPWNRFAQASAEADFAPRHALDRTPLLELFGWSRDEFLARTEGSALRRIDYSQWQRNVAVALGNAPYDPRIVAAIRRAGRCLAVGGRTHRLGADVAAERAITAS